jgi:hypothetical protein
MPGSSTVPDGGQSTSKIQPRESMMMFTVYHSKNQMHYPRSKERDIPSPRTLKF